MADPSLIMVALAWVTAHLALHVACRHHGALREEASLRRFHLVSAAGLGLVVLCVAASAWSTAAAAAAAVALALHGMYSTAVLENRASIEAGLAGIAESGTLDESWQSTLPHLARLDAWSRRSAWPLALAAFAVLFAAVAWFLLLRPTYSATFLEYYMKYLPDLTDRGFSGILDIAALGDPRPRLLPLLGVALNVALRRALLLKLTIHPAFGIAWLIYPAALAALYGAAYLLSGRRVTAVIACLLYAASPAALDVLVDYYMPAKPFVNLFFITGLLGLGVYAPHPALGRRRRPWLGTGVLFLSATAALLSDETAIFLLSTVAILMAPQLLDRKASMAERLAGPLALMGAFALYIWIGFSAFPALAASRGYVPVPLGTVMARGVYAAMFDTPQPLGSFLHTFDPGRLFETIVSAHAVLGRLVEANWTSALPFRHIWEVKPADYGQYLAALVAFAALLAAVRRETRRLAWLLVLAFALFVLVQSILIFPLAPWIVEVNYYASLSSIFVALIASVLLGDLAERRRCLPIAGLAAVWLSFTGFCNFLDTAARHPGFNDAPLHWADLRAARAEARAGHLLAMPGATPRTDQTASRGRKYLYALEVAMDVAHARGERVDLQPLQPITSAPLYASLDLEQLFDPHIPQLERPGPATRSEAVAEAGTAPSPLGIAALRGRHLRGSTAEWNFDIEVGDSGHVDGKTWRPGLMRLWALHGSLKQAPERTCFVFDRVSVLCLAALVRAGETYYGYDAAGRWLVSFRDVPSGFRRLTSHFRGYIDRRHTDPPGTGFHVAN